MKTFIKIAIGFIGGVLTSIGFCYMLGDYVDRHACEDDKIVNYANDLAIARLERNGYIVEGKPESNVVKMGFH